MNRIANGPVVLPCRQMYGRSNLRAVAETQTAPFPDDLACSAANTCSPPLQSASRPPMNAFFVAPSASANAVKLLIVDPNTPSAWPGGLNTC